MLSSPSRMNIHQPIARYIHFYIYRKKIFVRGVVRGIHFEKSLLQRLSPEGGQNWHKLPSHMSYNMPESNKNTTFAHHSGRKQRLFVNPTSRFEGRFFVQQSSLRMHNWLLLANQKAGRTKVFVFTLWNTFCIIFSHLMLIKVHFLALFWLFDQWISPNGLKWPPRAPRGPHPPRQNRQFWVNGSEFSNSVKRRWKYTKFAIRITKNLKFDPDPPLPP